jgi:hypothetical protein
LPVSGAEQLKISGAQGARPISSANGAYSRLVSPAPNSDSGKNKFHKPAALAAGLSSSTTLGVSQTPHFSNSP